MTSKPSTKPHHEHDPCRWLLKPSKLCVELIQYKTSGSVLDLGTGDGRNALYLAHHGFDVTAVDIDPARIQRLRKHAKELGVDVQTIVSDITQVELSDCYDVILAIATLHFLPGDVARSTIHKMKNHTQSGGFNVVLVFTENNPSKNFPYLFPTSELRDFYLDWEIAHYSEHITDWERHDHQDWHQHAVADVIARKPASCT